MLEGMFKKAADRTNDESLMWKIPAPKETNSITSAQTTFLVHSKSSRDPHKVTISKNGKVQCDKACVNWCTYSLCSHSLAVAEKNGLLKAFLALFKSSKHSPNATRLVNLNMPNNAGQKSGTKEKRGGEQVTPAWEKSSSVEFYSPHILWSVSHHRCRQESVSLHLLNPLPTLTAFRRPIQTSHSFTSTHLFLDQGSLHRSSQLSGKFHLTTVTSHLCQ